MWHNVCDVTSEWSSGKVIKPGLGTTQNLWKWKFHVYNNKNRTCCMIPNSDIYHFIKRLLHSNTWMFLILHVQISSTALSLPAWVDTRITFGFQQLYMVLNTKSVNNFFLNVSVIVTCNWSSGLFRCSSAKFLLCFTKDHWGGVNICLLRVFKY